MNELAKIILDALILSLELTDDEAKNVRALHSGHDNQLRLLHYPPIESSRLEDRYASRLGAHTDWSLFTLLFQDSHGGLQFFDRASETFIDAVPKEGVLYMNIGDMFQRVSNGKPILNSTFSSNSLADPLCTGYYPSALHRVIVKDPQAARYSIPYFVPPDSHRVIEPQASRVAKDGKQMYDPVTFAQYSEQMFRTIGVFDET